MNELLGKEVLDEVSGFTGVVVSAHNYINGCTRYTVQPKVKKDGTLPNTQTFDAPQLTIIKKKKFVGNTKTGGPSKYEDNAR